MSYALRQSFYPADRESQFEAVCAFEATRGLTLAFHDAVVADAISAYEHVQIHYVKRTDDKGVAYHRATFRMARPNMNRTPAWGAVLLLQKATPGSVAHIETNGKDYDHGHCYVDWQTKEKP